MAAVLACGPGAVLSHRAAADLLGLRSSSATKIDVTVRGTGGRGHEQIAVHRSRTLLDRDVIEVDGIPCTSVARTLLDLAELVDQDGLVKAIERAEIQQLFDLRAVEDVLDRAHGRRSAARLRAALAEVAIRPPTRNDLEQAFFEICVKARLPRPAVNRWIQVDGTSYQADFSWEDLGLIAETDGYETHGTRTAFEHDRRRDQKLAAAGWRIVRFTWRQVMYEPSAVAKTLRGLSAASPAPAR